MRRRRRRWRPRSQLHAHRPHRVLLPSEERDATTGGACRLGARAAARALRHQPQPRARRARELLARVAAVGLRPQRWRGEPVHQRLQPCATEAATLCIRGCVAPHARVATSYGLCLQAVKAKVHPPRLCGEATGLFACRTPHRPCPLGLSLVELRGMRQDSNAAPLLQPHLPRLQPHAPRLQPHAPRRARRRAAARRG